MAKARPSAVQFGMGGNGQGTVNVGDTLTGGDVEPMKSAA